MGDDAGCHSLPFRVPCAAYAHMPEEQPFQPPPIEDWTFFVLIRGGFFLKFVLCLYRLGGRIFVGLTSANPIARLRRLYLSHACISARYEPGSDFHQNRYDPPFYLVDQDSQPPTKVKLFLLPRLLGPAPLPHHNYTLSGCISFFLIGNPDLVQLSALPMPPSPVPSTTLATLVIGNIQHGLSQLGGTDQVEMRCAQDRSLYISKVHIHLFTEPSDLLSEKLGAGQAWLSLERFPAMVTLHCLEALLRGWFPALSRNWEGLKQTAALLRALRLNYAPLAGRLRGQLERAMAAERGPGLAAEEAVDVLSQALLGDFLLLANRGLVALAQAPDLPAWLQQPGGADAQPLHPFAGLVTRLRHRLCRLHTRPRP